METVAGAIIALVLTSEIGKFLSVPVRLYHKSNLHFLTSYEIKIKPMNQIDWAQGIAVPGIKKDLVACTDFHDLLSELNHSSRNG